jgi:hypothetical protein
MFNRALFQVADFDCRYTLRKRIRARFRLFESALAVGVFDIQSRSG